MPLAYTGMGAASWYGRGMGGGVGGVGPCGSPGPYVRAYGGVLTFMCANC